MNIVKAGNLACPMDGGLLVLKNKQLVCESGHAFDVAKQGYVNLLPVQFKRSKQPGDSKEMVAARTRFFESGLYSPIATRLSELVHKYAFNLATCSILDAGCGEGYYLNHIYNQISAIEGNDTCSMLGLDISKPAILSAAKTNKEITWLVGTNRQPPIDSGSVDLILSVFAFPCFDAFYPILKPGGIVILVDAGPDHLLQLRKIIYPSITPTASPPTHTIENIKYVAIDNQQLQYECTLNSNEQINNLLLMTPHFHRANKDGRALAMKLENLTTTVDVKFTLFKKR